MAKKANKKSPKDIALEEIMKKAQASMESEQLKEESRQVLKYGKEFAMFICWMQQCGLAPAIDAEKAKVVLASSTSLNEHPKELKKVLDYYERLKAYDLRQNLKSIEPATFGSMGKLWAHFTWIHLELPKDEGSAAPSVE